MIPKPLIWLLTLLAMTGCATIPGNPTTMTPEQLREIVKDKNANVGCATVQTPYKGNVVYLVLDKGIVVNGTMTVKSDCEITITNGSGAKP